MLKPEMERQLGEKRRGGYDLKPIFNKLSARAWYTTGYVKNVL
jgi:hypothetical protein